MKKFFAVLLTLSLLLGTGTAAIAKQPTSKSTTTTTTLSENSTYQFDYVLPDYVVTDKDAKLGVTLKNTVLGKTGFDDAYIKFSATGPGSVNFTKDSANTYVGQGTLADFDLPAQYNATTNWTLKFTEDGTYTITFKLFDTNDKELVKKTQEIKVTDGVLVFTVTDKVYSNAEVTVDTRFITEQDYEDVHFAFAKSSGTGDVIFKAQDTNDTSYTFTNAGDLKPASFDIVGPYDKTTTSKLTFTAAGTYEITFKLVDDNSNVLIKNSQKVIVKTVTDEDEDEEIKGKGNTHGLVNAVRNHLKFKKNGKSPSDSQSLKVLMEKLEDRGLAEDVLKNLKESIAELEDAIAELENAIAEDSDADNYKALAKMKALKGKKYETYIDGKKVDYADAEPIVEKSRTLVPFRKLAEILGADVAWNQEKREITVTKDAKTVVITIDKNTATIDGKTVTLDTSAKIYKNRTLVPLRFLAEAFDTTVDFYPEGALISIKKNQK